MNFPILSSITLLPALGALFILFSKVKKMKISIKFKVMLEKDTSGMMNIIIDIIQKIFIGPF